VLQSGKVFNYKFSNGSGASSLPKLWQYECNQTWKNGTKEATLPVSGAGMLSPHIYPGIYLSGLLA
jgi:hypothetical protein